MCRQGQFLKAQCSRSFDISKQQIVHCGAFALNDSSPTEPLKILKLFLNPSQSDVRENEISNFNADICPVVIVIYKSPHMIEMIPFVFIPTFSHGYVVSYIIDHFSVVLPTSLRFSVTLHSLSYYCTFMQVISE